MRKEASQRENEMGSKRLGTRTRTGTGRMTWVAWIGRFKRDRDHPYWGGGSAGRTHFSRSQKVHVLVPVQAHVQLPSFHLHLKDGQMLIRTPEFPDGTLQYLFISVPAPAGSRQGECVDRSQGASAASHNALDTQMDARKRARRERYPYWAGLDWAGIRATPEQGWRLCSAECVQLPAAASKHGRRSKVSEAKRSDAGVRHRPSAISQSGSQAVSRSGQCQSGRR